MFTLSQTFDDQSEVDKGNEHYIEFVKTREDAPKALQAAEQSLDFVSTFVHFAVVLPGLNACTQWRHDRDEAKIERELPGFIALVRFVHQEVQRAVRRAQAFEQCAPLRSIAGLAGRQSERYGCSSIRGNHMNLDCPSSARFADGLWSIFFNAPVPSG